MRPATIIPPKLNGIPICRKPDSLDHCACPLSVIVSVSGVRKKERSFVHCRRCYCRRLNAIDAGRLLCNVCETVSEDKSISFNNDVLISLLINHF
jgi:hypothetical protein